MQGQTDNKAKFSSTAARDGFLICGAITEKPFVS